MRGSQEDMGETLLNLAAGRMNSVSIYFEKTQDTELRPSLFSRFEMETPRCLDVFESLQSFGANLFGEESSKGIEHERKFMMILMPIALW